MKALLKLLTVCLITLVMLSPVLVVWKIWQYHSEFVNAQRAVLVEHQPIAEQAMIVTQKHGELSPLPFAQQPFQSISSTVTTSAFLGFMVSVPLGFCSGLLLNNRYQTRRHTVLKQQIAILEKIWQQSMY